MYIPSWILIGLVVVAFVYFARSKQPKGSLNLLKQSENAPQYSYRLAISMEPNWYQILKKIYAPKDEKEWEKYGQQIKAIKKDQDADMCGRRYGFTEYYDAATGLTQRFQATYFASGKRLIEPVDEFGDRGKIFESLDSYDMKIDEEERKFRKQLTVDIGEDFIRKNIYDEHIGGPKFDFDYEKEDYLFSFPLHDVFNFRYALGSRFDETEECTIIKWPDAIEKKFKALGIKYETYFDYEPEPFKMEEYDKQFFERMGKPKVISGGSSRFHHGYLSSDEAFFSVSLKLFRPDENYRISSNFSAA